MTRHKAWVTLFIMATPDSSPLAAERLEALLSADPDNFGLREHCIAGWADVKNYSRAAAIARQGLQRHPGNAALGFQLANCLIGLRDYEGALSILESLDSLPESAAEAMEQNRGLCLFMIGRYRDAAEALGSLATTGSRDPGLLRLLIVSLHHLTELEQAKTIIESVRDSVRQDSALAGAAALVYLDSGDASQAARYASVSLARDSHCVDALIVDGILRTAKLDLAGSRQRFAEALAEAPQTGRAYLGLAIADMLENQLDSALRHAERSVEFMGQHSGSWIMLGWLQLLSEQLDASSGSFSQAIELDRSFAEGHGGMAALAALRGDNQKAQQLIEVAERLDPECLGSRFARSVLLGAQGDAQAAQQLILSALTGLSGAGDGPLQRLIAQAGRGRS